jgi:glycosyltransferase involved in cell wall biosynthesis
MVTSVPMPPVGGLGYYVWNLSQFLMKQGHEVQIITRGQRGKPFYGELEGVPIWRPQFYPVYPLHVHLHRLFVQPLVRRLEAEVDVFHLHTPLPTPIRSRRPFLVTVHTPMIGEAKAVQITSLRSLAIRLQIPVSIQIERRVFTSASKIVAVAQSVVGELQAYGLDEKQVEVLGNGVDTDVFCPDKQYRWKQPREIYILAVGRLDVRKGLEDLIEAMSYVVNRFPNARLYIAGEGPLETQLRARAGESAFNGAVQFLGRVKERAEMVQLYRGAAVFAHAAHYEGLPTVLLEAMACGKSVVSTAVSGALDAVQDGVNGLLVPPRAPGRLAEAICRLLDDADLRTQLGTTARRTAEDRFSWQVVGSNYVRCYRSLLGGADQ